MNKTLWRLFRLIKLVYFQINMVKSQETLYHKLPIPVIEWYCELEADV